MNLIGIVVLIFGPVLIWGFQNSYVVIQERIEREYVNKSLMDLTCGVYKSNRTTNALNATVKLKHELQVNDKVIITGYKWLSNEYRLDIIQFEETIKNVITYKYFDANRLFINYTTPSFTWPLKPNVIYRMFNWIPESTEFPPGIPEGKWKLMMNATTAAGTQIFAVSWYFRIEYKVKYFEFEGHKSRGH